MTIDIKLLEQEMNQEQNEIEFRRAVEVQKAKINRRKRFWKTVFNMMKGKL